MNTSPLLNWSKVNPDNWSFSRQQAYTGQVIFEISKLPNFAEPRFKSLGEGLEDRKSVIARHQTEMLMNCMILVLDMLSPYDTAAMETGYAYMLLLERLDRAN